MITSVTYERLYNLGNYENEKLGVVVAVVDGDVETAFNLARETVEAEHARMRNPKPAEPLDFSKTPPVPATPKQRNYIATLQDQLGWHSEQLAAYASQQSVDLVAMSMRQASTFIDGMKRLATESSTATPMRAGDGDIPF